MKLDLRPQNRKQPFVLPRLLKEVAGPAAHGFHCQVNIGPGRHHDDGRRVVHGNDLRKEVEAFPTGSCIPRVVQINKEGIVGAGGQCLPNQGRGSRRLDFVSLRAQEKIDGFENMLLVVRSQDTGTDLAVV